MTTHHMFDIESASCTNRGAITQIGVVSIRVDQKRRVDIYDGCNLKININDYDRPEMREKFDVSIDTMLWWAEQDATTRKAAIGICSQKVQEGRTSLALALFNLTLYMDQSNHSKKIKVWAKPPTFDLVKIGYAYETMELPLPWHFSEERCLRTMLDICDKDVNIHGRMLNNPEGGGRYRAKHDAYDDAEYQAEQLIGCLRQLGRVQ